MKNYDVIIIGAGPSGIFCAYELIHAKKEWIHGVLWIDFSPRMGFNEPIALTLPIGRRTRPWD